MNLPNSCLTLTYCSIPSQRLSYGSKTQHLSSSFDPFEHEYYRTAMPPPTTQSSARAPHSVFNYLGKGRGTNFQPKAAPKTGSKAAVLAAATSHTSKSTTSGDGTADMSAIAGGDAALAALKTSLASETARKKDNT